MRNALQRRYDRAMNGRSKDNGFTLIELIVVVVILGVLAAIAIPAFLSQRQRAYDATTQSDVKNASVAMESAYAAELAYPADSTEAADLDVKVSDDVTLTVYIDNSPGEETYTIVGEHAKSDTTFVLKSDEGATPKKDGTAPTGTAAFKITAAGPAAP